MRRRKPEPQRRFTIQGYTTNGDLYDCVEKLADMEGRTISWVVVKAVEEYCKKKKMEFLPPPDDREPLLRKKA